MSTIRKAHRSKFTPIANDVAQNSDLSFEARGCLFYLLSKSDDWEATPEDVEREGRIGKEKRLRIFQELEAAGHMVREQHRRPNGTIETVTMIYEQPVPEAERKKLRRTRIVRSQPQGTQPHPANPPVDNFQNSPQTAEPHPANLSAVNFTKIDGQPQAANPSAGKFEKKPQGTQPHPVNPSAYLIQNNEKKEHQQQSNSSSDLKSVDAGGERVPPGWVLEVGKSPAYVHLDVVIVYWKMVEWCKKDPKKSRPDRQNLLSWLNREYQATKTGVSRGQQQHRPKETPVEHRNPQSGVILKPNTRRV